MDLGGWAALRAKSVADSVRAAEEAYGKALALWRSVKDDAGASDALVNIGVVRVMQGDPAQGNMRLLESLALRQCMPEKRPIAGVFTNLAVTLQDLGQDRKSIVFARAALREQSTDVRINAIGVYLLALAHQKLGDGNSALE